MRFFWMILVLAIIILGITFSLLNAQPVAINYYIGSHTFPLSLLLVISFVVGVFLSFLMLGISIIKIKSKNRKLKKRLKVVEKEIDNLRTMPVRD